MLKEGIWLIRRIYLHFHIGLQCSASIVLRGSCRPPIHHRFSAVGYVHNFSALGEQEETTNADLELTYNPKDSYSLKSRESQVYLFLSRLRSRFVLAADSLH